MERFSKVSLALVLLGLLGACSFRPRFSSQDKDCFLSPPCIVERTNSYSLRWQYGGSFFVPESKVVDGQLLFCLTSSTSGGELKGTYGEIQIKNAKKIQALENGGAYWLEPNGQKTLLEVKKR